LTPPPGLDPSSARAVDAPPSPAAGAAPPSVLIVVAKWWSLSARLAAELVRHGWRVSVLCPAGHPIVHVRDLARVERYRGIRSLSCLSQTIKSVRPDLIIPCDDGVVAQLHALHEGDPSLGPLIEASLGHPASFAIVRSRRRLLEVAAELGVPVPETLRVASVEDVASWHRERADASVVKRDGESGGNGVRVCTSLGDAMASWRELSAPYSLATGVKRLTIDRDPLALWQREHCPEPEITLQRLVEGRPANTMAACLDGEVLAEVSVIVLAADGPTGAATIIKRINEPRMTQAASLLARRLKLSGFFGLDFMIEASTGIPYLIEMNPRCTQLGHLEFLDQGSLAGVFTAKWLGIPLPRASKPIPLETVALFPQALRTLPPGSRQLEDAYLDLPSDQPALASELKLDSWPERRWVARLYHSVRPMVRAASVEYDHLAAPRNTPPDAALVRTPREAATSR
jgi:hypothetical protein